MTGDMKIGVVLPLGEGESGAGMPSYELIRAIARQTEAGGLDSVWVADHLIMRFPGEPEVGVHEAWTVLAALAEATERVDLGTIVLCSSFRNPGLVAKMATTLDEVSAGRLILGLGCGWHDPEYEAFGYPTDHKVGRFDEALQIVAGLLRGGRVTRPGRYHDAADAVLLPAPSRDIPLLVAATGPRMLRLTVRDAQLWNTAWFGRPDDRLAARRADLAAALAAAGRDPASLEETVGVRVRPAGVTGPPTEAPGATLEVTVEGLADLLDDYAALGIGQVLAWVDPTTPETVAWLIEGAAAHRGRRDRAGTTT